MPPLLAKSAGPGRPGRTLAEHTCDVADAFVALFGTPGGPTTRLGERWAVFFRLPELTAFLHHGLAAALLHDWGKANDGFQGMLQGQGRQLIRHEHLSALLIHLPTVTEWLSGRRDLDQDIILAAVVTHHLRASYETLGQPRGETDLAVRVLCEEESFQDLLKEIAARLELAWPANHDVEPVWSFEPQAGDVDLRSRFRDLKRRLDEFDYALEADEPRRRLLWAVRSSLISADAAGSGLIREGHSVTRWIDEAFDRSRLLDGRAIRTLVVDPQVQALSDRGLWRDWNAFQQACDDLPDRALLLAPCGSGKTLAAWRWIAARLDVKHAARVIFLYPTRGTATEGFRDYVSWAPEADAALVHGTSTYDLEGLFEDAGDDPRRGRSYESDAKLFALSQWPKRIFAATVDQFFAFMQYGYAPMCHLPLLVDSVVVVDEVHSFDRGMFSALQDFLQTFDVPVLCMTATLPPERQELLEGCGLRVYPQEMPDDLRRSAEYPRYAIRTIASDAAEQHVREALAVGKRVLWVLNTVPAAQAAAASVASDAEADRLMVGDVPLFCYHSRFKLEDRTRQHRAVVSAFKSGTSAPRAVLAIATQVCEMSLDLDAEVLVTAQAPVPSLIQRMGRCCREALPKSGRYGEVLVFTPETPKPYTREQWVGVPEFLARVTATPRVSQRDLQVALAEAAQPPEFPKPSQFLRSGPWALVGEGTFRDSDQWTRPAILSDDVPEFERFRSSRTDAWKADGLVMSVPRYLARGKDDRLPGYLAVAAGGQYSPSLGYLAKPR